jgi:hypothetical protein
MGSPAHRLSGGRRDWHPPAGRLVILEQQIMNIASRTLVLVFLTLPVGFVAGCASTDSRERQPIGEYIDDSVITTRVKAAMAGDPDVSVMEVSVETYDGVVQLSGFVSTQAQINRAVELARGVPGVQSVRNDMRIR